jgi:hypothetical protein
MYSVPISRLPDELLREICLQATSIHGEWDVSTNHMDPGYSCSNNEDQITAWEHVLPDRLNITKVCHRWYRIAVEFLYGSFHAKDHQEHLISPFRTLLESRPEIGYLVKRLSFDLDFEEISADQVAIISLCPNVIIFYRFPVYTITHKWWASTPFPSSLREFDSGLNGQTWATVVAVLNGLPNLEILHLHFDDDDDDYLDDFDYPTLSLPSLRVLRLRVPDADATTLQIIAARLHLPRLVALTFSSTSFLFSRPRMTANSSRYSSLNLTPFNSPFSTQILGRLVSLHTWNHPCATKAEDLVSIRQVVLTTIPEDDFAALVPHIPFHRVTHLVICLDNHLPRGADICSWLSQFYDRMCFPLSSTAMPALRILEMKWSFAGLSHAAKSHSQCGAILSLFNLLATRFEQRGIQFIEAQTDLRKAQESINDIVHHLQKEKPKRYSNEKLENIARDFRWGAKVVVETKRRVYVRLSAR